MREGRVVLEASVFDYIKEIGQDGFRKVPKWGKTVTFEAVRLQDGFRYNNRAWRGTKEVEGELAALLMNHPAYGRDFIAFKEEGGDAQLIDTFFEKKDGGGVYCWLTQRNFVNAQGAEGHKTSNQFKEAVDEYLNASQDAFS